MGNIAPAKPVVPLVAILYGNASAYKVAREQLLKMLGDIEFESEVYDFCATDYYTESMGPTIKRVFLAFSEPTPPECMVRWKHATNELESELAAQFGGGRPINLDPGYITSAKLVLASTKDFAHRIYLADSIYAEVTLLFRRGEWISHDYTFPEYREKTYHDFFSRVRARHVERFRQGATS